MSAPHEDAARFRGDPGRTRWSPVATERLPDLIAERVSVLPGIVRLAVDGPPCARPDDLAERLVEPLRVLGRPVEHVRASSFWRDASLRLEYGREDVESFLSWLDADALRREVLVPAAQHGVFLPSLRDPATNRSTREAPRELADDSVLVVSGELLLGLGLPFDLTVHLAMSPAARARRLDPQLAWTLPAYDEYDATVTPSEVADIVIRMDDPRHPAAQGLGT